MKDGKDQLYVIRPDGSEMKQLTAGEEVWTYDWSPDSKRIVYNLRSYSDLEALKKYVLSKYHRVS